MSDSKQDSLVPTQAQDPHGDGPNPTNNTDQDVSVQQDRDQDIDIDPAIDETASGDEDIDIDTGNSGNTGGPDNPVVGDSNLDDLFEGTGNDTQPAASSGNPSLHLSLPNLNSPMMNPTQAPPNRPPRVQPTPNRDPTPVPTTQSRTTRPRRTVRAAPTIMIDPDVDESEVKQDPSASRRARDSHRVCVQFINQLPGVFRPNVIVPEYFNAWASNVDRRNHNLNVGDDGGWDFVDYCRELDYLATALEANSLPCTLADFTKRSLPPRRSRRANNNDPPESDDDEDDEFDGFDLDLGQAPGPTEQELTDFDSVKGHGGIRVSPDILDKIKNSILDSVKKSNLKKNFKPQIAEALEFTQYMYKKNPESMRLFRGRGQKPVPGQSVILPQPPLLTPAQKRNLDLNLPTQQEQRRKDYTAEVLDQQRADRVETERRDQARQEKKAAKKAKKAARLKAKEAKKAALEADRLAKEAEDQRNRELDRRREVLIQKERARLEERLRELDRQVGIELRPTNARGQPVPPQMLKQKGKKGTLPRQSIKIPTRKSAQRSNHSSNNRRRVSGSKREIVDASPAPYSKAPSQKKRRVSKNNEKINKVSFFSLSFLVGSLCSCLLFSVQCTRSFFFLFRCFLSFHFLLSPVYSIFQFLYLYLICFDSHLCYSGV